MATNLINKLMEQLQDQSLPTIGLLQDSFPNTTGFMINISTLFDPRYVFLVYAPILFALNKRVGHRMVIALTIAEWANQILKWLLAGERPYWYVHEKAAAAAAAAAVAVAAASDLATNTSTTPIYATNEPNPLDTNNNLNSQTTLKQFAATCELGAGSPSGHSMVAATVWYIIIAAHLAGELKPIGRAKYSNNNTNAKGAPPSKQIAIDSHQTIIEKTNNQQLARCLWLAYAIILLLISVSRVYLACHFPHQCLAGALLGALLAKLVVEWAPMGQLRRRHFAHATWLMFAAVLATYAGLQSTGFDPLWSVSKAMRWCAKKEYIHLDTTPFFSMTRYLGFCLGAGLAYDSSKLIASGTDVEPQNGSRLLLLRRLLTSIVSIGFGQFLLALPAPRSNLNLFYVISFIIYTTFSYAIAGPIPNLTKRLMAATTIKRHHHPASSKVSSNGFSRTFMKNKKHD